MVTLTTSNNSRYIFKHPSFCITNGLVAQPGQSTGLLTFQDVSLEGLTIAEQSRNPGVGGSNPLGAILFWDLKVQITSSSLELKSQRIMNSLSPRGHFILGFKD